MRKVDISSLFELLLAPLFHVSENGMALEIGHYDVTKGTNSTPRVVKTPQAS